MDRVILHCDLNNFYASVECLNHPEYHDKPVAVAGDPKKRTGIILAKNYIAKSAGVETGEVIWKAKQKCPDLICLPPHHDEYAIISKKVKNIYYRFTDYIEPFGLDECWLDVTSSQKLFGDGKTIADTIRETVKQEMGLTISVGVSFSKMFAKLGSDLKKPDATSIISRENYRTVAWRLPVNALMYVGRHRIKDFEKLNIHTIGDLAQYDEKTLITHFGVNGKYLKQIANGEEPDTVCKYNCLPPIKSVGNGTTAITDIDSLNECKQLIYHLSEQVSTRLRQKGLEGSCITLTIKDNSLSYISKAHTINYSTSNADDISKECLKLLDEIWTFGSVKKIRAIRIKCSSLLSSSDPIQTLLFDTGRKDKLIRQDKSVDKIRNKYGYDILRRGILMNTNIINIEADDEFFDE